MKIGVIPSSELSSKSLRAEDNLKGWILDKEFVNNERGICVRVTRFEGGRHPRYSMEIGRVNPHNGDYLARHLHVLINRGNLEGQANVIFALVSKAEHYIEQRLEELTD